MAPPVKNIHISGCTSTTINLSTAHTGVTPTNHYLYWYDNNSHSGTPLTNTQIANAPVGTYYAFYYNLSNSCFSPAAQVVVTKDNCPPVCSLPTPTVTSSIENLCPATSVNLNTAYSGTIPAGSQLLWYTNNNHTGTALSGTAITQAPAGTYYAFYYNSSTNCFSSAASVTVTISDCTPAVCFKDPNTSGSGSETKIGITVLKPTGEINSNTWPSQAKSGHIALQSNSLGMVITRLTKADLGNITSPQEGMIVYDTTDKCLKIYGNNGWLCFNTPSCP